jgi:hypothetical protein
MGKGTIPEMKWMDDLAEHQELAILKDALRQGLDFASNREVGHPGLRLEIAPYGREYSPARP